MIHVILILYPVNMVYHVDWFICVESFLYHKDRFYLVTVNGICCYIGFAGIFLFFEDLCVYIQEDTDL